MKKIAVLVSLVGLYAPLLAQPPVASPEIQDLAKAAKKILDSPALRDDLRSVVSKQIAQNLLPEQKKLAQELVDVAQELIYIDQVKLAKEAEEYGKKRDEISDKYSKERAKIIDRLEKPGKPILIEEVKKSELQNQLNTYVVWQDPYGDNPEIIKLNEREEQELQAIPRGPETLKKEQLDKKMQKNLGPFLNTFANLIGQDKIDAYVYEWLGVLAGGIEQGLGKPKS
jgi:hypothetical protein